MSKTSSGASVATSLRSNAMRVWPVKFLTALKTASLWLSIAIISVVLASGLHQALAFFSGTHVHNMNLSPDNTTVRGHVTATGLPGGARVQALVNTGDGEAHDIWTRTDKSGFLSLSDLDLIDPKAEKLVLRLNIFSDNQDHEFMNFAISFDAASGAVDISGSGLRQSDRIEVSFDDKSVSSSYVDWAGQFKTGPIAGAPFANLKGQICTKASSRKPSKPGSSFEICFSKELASKGKFSLVQFTSGPFSSPFSTWTFPGDCAPAGTVLSVCYPDHISAWQNSVVLNFVRAFMAMTQQLTTVMVQQAQIFGAFLDAKHQLERQRWIQEKAAEAHRDYHPSQQICFYATFSQEFTNLMRRTRYNARALNSYFLNRDLGPSVAGDQSLGAGAPAGPSQDFRTRLEQYRSTYCDVDFNSAEGQDFMCDGGPAGLINNDVDYTRLDTIYTLDLNFEEAANTQDETDVLAMGKNLFAHELMPRPSPSDVLDEPNDIQVEGARALLDMRSIYAMRSVLRDSFAQIQAMRGNSAGLTTAYITSYLEDMGMDAFAIADMIGPNPSERGLLSVMMNTMYQHPDFYTQTYDTGANVERVRTAMQMIENIGARKQFETARRNEMVWTMILEARLRKAQNDLDAEVQKAVD